MGGVRNGVMEEVPGWDLNKKAGHHEAMGTVQNYVEQQTMQGQCETMKKENG